MSTYHNNPKPFRTGRHARKKGYERHDYGPITKRIVLDRMIPQDVARA